MSTTDGFIQRCVRLTFSDGSWRVSPKLKAKLVADAERTDSNMTDVARRILSERYGVPLNGLAGRRAAAGAAGDQLQLVLPDALDEQIAAVARRSRRSLQDEILHALSAHYGLPAPKPRRRVRRRRARAVV